MLLSKRSARQLTQAGWKVEAFASALDFELQHLAELRRMASFNPNFVPAHLGEDDWFERQEEHLLHQHDHARR